MALGERGLRIDAVACGVINTDMSGFTKGEAKQAVTRGMHAMKRIAQPDDVADAGAFLA